MREILAKWIAALTGMAVCAMAVLFAFIQNDPPEKEEIFTLLEMSLPRLEEGMPADLLQQEIDQELGRILFRALKCGGCHEAEGTGNPHSPLDGIAGRLDKMEIRRWIVSPRDMDPDIVKPDYGYLSREQVELLVAYLESLK
jgi:cytochrome c553